MGAAADAHAARLRRPQQGRQQGLQHQGATAGGADGEAVVAAADRPRLEAQDLGAKLGPSGSGATYLGRRQHRGQVLAQQPRAAAPGANIMDTQGLAGEHRQAQGAAQYLAAADGAVQFDYILFHHIPQA